MAPILLAGDPPPVGQITVEQIRQLVFATNERVRQTFRERYGALIERAVVAIASAHDHLDLFRSRAPHVQMSATLELLFHAAINSLLAATHHLISGFPTASGNMLRQHTEAVAMALLCLDRTSGVLDEFARNLATYPVHKAPNRLLQRKRARRLESLIGFDASAWAKVLELNELYDSLSHASSLSLAHTQFLGTDNLALLGGEYDPFKAEAYEKDLRRCATAAEVFVHLLSVILVRCYPVADAT